MSPYDHQNGWHHNSNQTDYDPESNHGHFMKAHEDETSRFTFQHFVVKKKV